MCMNWSTKSGETKIGSTPRSSCPVVMFLTFFADDQREEDDRWLWHEEVLSESVFGTGISGGGFLIVSW